MTDANKQTRLPISGEAIYRVQGGLTPPHAVLVNEISAVGLKFVATETLSANDVLELSIKVSDLSDSLMATGKVVWQKHISSKFLLETYVEFTQMNPEHKNRLLSYISNFAENIKVKRNHARCAMMTDVQYRLMEGPARMHSSLSADICVKGMKLLAEERLDVNTKLKLTFDLPGERGLFNLTGRVAWKQEEEGRVLALGIEFIEMGNKDKERILRFINYKLSLD